MPHVPGSVKTRTWRPQKDKGEKEKEKDDEKPLEIEPDSEECQSIRPSDWQGWSSMELPGHAKMENADGMNKLFNGLANENADGMNTF
eukprot:9673884-Karenia_brevis.AAC.1